MELGLDFDIHDNDDMQRFHVALAHLRNKYGSSHVLFRKSSSGKGYHIWVVGHDFTPEEEIEVRKILGDCKGRRIADEGRLKGKLRTSRLFKYKGSVNTKTGQSKIKKARKWQ